MLVQRASKSLKHPTQPEGNGISSCRTLWDDLFCRLLASTFLLPESTSLEKSKRSHSLPKAAIVHCGQEATTFEYSQRSCSQPKATKVNFSDRSQHLKCHKTWDSGHLKYLVDKQIFSSFLAVTRISTFFPLRKFYFKAAKSRPGSIMAQETTYVS